MLVLGNLAGSKYVNTVSSQTIEVIHTNATEKKVKRELKLFGNPVRFNKYSQYYMIGSVNYVLHNADSIYILKYILDMSFCGDDFKLASPYIQYVWSKAMTSFKHNEVGDWIDACLLHSRLHETYFNPQISPELFVKSTELASQLDHVMGFHPLINHKLNIYNKFDFYTRQSLLNFYSVEAKSLYYDLLVKPGCENQPMFRDYLSLSKWKELCKREKLEAVLERVYADIANEILLDDILSGVNVDVYDEVDLLYRQLMQTASQRECKWLSNFIGINFKEIMKFADLNYINATKHAVFDGILEETIYT